MLHHSHGSSSHDHEALVPAAAAVLANANAINDCVLERRMQALVWSGVYSMILDIVHLSVAELWRLPAIVCAQQTPLTRNLPYNCACLLHICRAIASAHVEQLQLPAP